MVTCVTVLKHIPNMRDALKSVTCSLDNLNKMLICVVCGADHEQGSVMIMETSVISESWHFLDKIVVELFNGMFEK